MEMIRTRKMLTTNRGMVGTPAIIPAVSTTAITARTVTDKNRLGFPDSFFIAISPLLIY